MFKMVKCGRYLDFKMLIWNLMACNHDEHLKHIVKLVRHARIVTDGSSERVSVGKDSYGAFKILEVACLPYKVQSLSIMKIW